MKMSLRKKLRLDETHDSGFDQNAESKYFRNEPVLQTPNEISQNLLQIELNLVSQINTITFDKPVDYVYSPIEYAYETHSNFVNKYCNSRKKVLFLGLNPGPWGMSQNGVPFGEVNIVKEWLQIEGNVGKPAKECPARPINGLNCTRSEISGKRFWGLFQEICGTAENFFTNAYIHNYCPIALMKGETGANITPPDLKGPISKQLLTYCDGALTEVITLLQVEKVVAIGRFVEKRVKDVLKGSELNHIEVLYLAHPSPRVIRNENWPEKALKTLTDLDLLKYFSNGGAVL